MVYSITYNYCIVEVYEGQLLNHNIICCDIHDVLFENITSDYNIVQANIGTINITGSVQTISMEI